jgi:hypothetical protein
VEALEEEALVVDPVVALVVLVAVASGVAEQGGSGKENLSALL